MMRMKYWKNSFYPYFFSICPPNVTPLTQPSKTAKNFVLCSSRLMLNQCVKYSVNIRLPCSTLSSRLFRQYFSQHLYTRASLTTDSILRSILRDFLISSVFAFLLAIISLGSQANLDKISNLNTNLSKNVIQHHRAQFKNIE